MVNERAPSDKKFELIERNDAVGLQITTSFPCKKKIYAWASKLN
jgi:hypothetical protein